MGAGHRKRLRRRTHRFYTALEGIDGSGKTTALPGVAEIIRSSGLTVSELRYTDKDNVLGNLIAWLYRDAADAKWPIRQIRGFRPLQAALYSTNGRVNLVRRARHSDMLLTDRSVLSGYASHVGRVPGWFLALVEPVYVPDLIVFLEIEPLEASARLDLRGAGGYEEDLQSLRDFKRDYHLVMDAPPRRLRKTVILKVDASVPREDVVASAASLILNELGRR